MILLGMSAKNHAIATASYRAVYSYHVLLSASTSNALDVFIISIFEISIFKVGRDNY